MFVLLLKNTVSYSIRVVSAFIWWLNAKCLVKRINFPECRHCRLVQNTLNVCFNIDVCSGFGACHVKLPRSILISLTLISSVVRSMMMLFVYRYWN